MSQYLFHFFLILENTLLHISCSECSIYIKVRVILDTHANFDLSGDSMDSGQSTLTWVNRLHRSSQYSGVTIGK